MSMADYSLKLLKLRFLFVVLSVFLVLGTAFQVSGGFRANGPTEQLKPELDNLFAILLDKSMKGEEKKSERRSRIMETISSGFDFQEMSRRVLGKTWNRITPEQQDYFVQQMTKLLENVYIGKLEGYSGQTIEFVEERIKGSRAQVTTLIQSEGGAIPIHYIMRETKGSWMVYDINIEGVSLIRNYMEQFKSIIRKEKYEGLIKVIEDKNRSFAEGNGS
ncbi:MAG: organic solvent tolerance ABC transporter substrate-binding protein [Proteobacteria bacterium]|nr:MAG: organic solvent tolerance ABC transporter substrate-binding protein [Pseudomonadota bacterium]